MSRPVIALALVFVAVGAPIAGVAVVTADGASTPTPADEAAVAPGDRLQAAVGVQRAEVDGDIRERSFGVAFTTAGTNDSKAAAVGALVEDLEARLGRLEQRKRELDAARDNGTISKSEYRAELTVLAARIATVRRLANQSAAASRRLPAAALERRGVDPASIRALGNRAANLTGPEVAAIARSVAGERTGKGLAGGNRPNVTGPPSGGPGGGPPGGNVSGPPGENGGNESGPPGEGGGNESGPPGENGGNESGPSAEDGGNGQSNEGGGNESGSPGEGGENTGGPPEGGGDGANASTAGSNLPAVPEYWVGRAGFGAIGVDSHLAEFERSDGSLLLGGTAGSSLFVGDRHGSPGVRDMAPAVPSSVGRATAEEGEPLFSVDLRTEGSARVTLRLAFDLSTDSDRKAFRTMQDDEEARADVRDRFESRLQDVANNSERRVDREMRVDDAAIALSTNDDGSTGVVTLSVSWTNLAGRTDDADPHLVITEPFASGFTPSRQFSVRITAPDRYRLTTVRPDPDGQTNASATWEAGTKLTDFTLVFAPGSATPLPDEAVEEFQPRSPTVTTAPENGSSSIVSLLVGVGIAVAIAIGGALLWRRRREESELQEPE
ncbi:MAG: hypothetical protein ABEH66_02405 [Halobacteriales archaeon]